jgi:hypothetical protein
MPATKSSPNSNAKKKQPAAAAVPVPPATPAPPAKILAIDIGGTKVKLLLSGETEARKFPSGKRLTPQRMIEGVQGHTQDWKYDAVTIGYPGLVGEHGPRSEPGNLGPGWVGFDFSAAFGVPMKIVNDAAMQALGSYEGGRMLFLGLGTGLGSALIADHVILPLELGRLKTPDGSTLGAVLGHQGLERLGKGEWRKAVHDWVVTLMGAFVVDHVVLGGGNAKLVKELPPGTRIGHNLMAFRGGFRLWNVDDIPALPADGSQPPPPPDPVRWRLI